MLCRQVYYLAPSAPIDETLNVVTKPFLLVPIQTRGNFHVRSNLTSCQTGRGRFTGSEVTACSLPQAYLE